MTLHVGSRRTTLCKLYSLFHNKVKEKVDKPFPNVDNDKKHFIKTAYFGIYSPIQVEDRPSNLFKYPTILVCPDERGTTRFTWVPVRLSTLLCRSKPLKRQAQRYLKGLPFELTWVPTHGMAKAGST